MGNVWVELEPVIRGTRGRNQKEPRRAGVCRSAGHRMTSHRTEVRKSARETGFRKETEFPRPKAAAAENLGDPPRNPSLEV